MAIDKIRPFDDPRISLRSAILNGYTYGYLYSTPPEGTPYRGTIVLVHGFPDISFGWRYQIPFLNSLGLTTIAIDCLGYGRSDAPPTSCLSVYTYKRIATDIGTLCSQLKLSSIILGGHDWGGAIVYRVAQYHPHLVTALFSICTPYEMPRAVYMPLQKLVSSIAPNFTYQLSFASGELEKHIRSPFELQQFLSSLYGARTVPSASTKGLSAFHSHKAYNTNLLPHIGQSTLLTPDELAYYTHQYSRSGINGPLNWYRTRELNYLNDLDFFFDGALTDPEKHRKDIVKVEQECLFVLATRDHALPPEMARGMNTQRIPKLTRREVEAGHWALWQKPEECNRVIGEWLEEKVFKDSGSSGGETMFLRDVVGKGVRSRL